MKVNISQGHEKGIGLEVLFKTCLLLSARELSSLKLFANRHAVKATLDLLNIPFSLSSSGIQLAGLHMDTEWLEEGGVSQSFTSLERAMTEAKKGGVLYTLPTSKDQFPGFAGHTEFFRAHFHQPELGMYFSSPSLRVLLLSDHVAISKLSSELTEASMYQRLAQALRCFGQWQIPTKRILVSGLNPHAGEQGLIGREDERISRVLTQLQDDFNIEMSGPHPGDTMLLEQRSALDLLVYLFHDQGLGVFKSMQGFIGSNITLGLPYPRLSPDHGTSFNLYGKNQADYRGCSYSLREAISLLKKVSHGKNSSHQGQST